MPGPHREDRGQCDGGDEVQGSHPQGEGGHNHHDGDCHCAAERDHEGQVDGDGERQHHPLRRSVATARSAEVEPPRLG